jgi:hypothetical protein
MKTIIKLKFILLISFKVFSQEIIEIPFEEREYFLFNKENLTIKPIKVDSFLIENNKYTISVHEGTTFFLKEMIDSVINYKSEDYWEWQFPFKLSMYFFHDSLENILLFSHFNEDECECTNSLLEEVFDEQQKVYKNISIGDLLKSDKLKKYHIVFYNTVNEKEDKTIYQHELVIWVDLKFNPFIKSQRKTRRITYMIPFQEAIK